MEDSGVYDSPTGDKEKLSVVFIAFFVRRDSSRVHSIYVVDDEDRLKGRLSLKRFIDNF
jgi:Mg/Co/Ni transporter MgtE